MNNDMRGMGAPEKRAPDKPGAGMSESREDQFERVRMMTSDSSTWDLSCNDMAALSTVLHAAECAQSLQAENARLTSEVARLREALKDMLKVADLEGWYMVHAEEVIESRNVLAKP